MNPTALNLPERAAKPRKAGLTMVIDGGIPLGLFTDLISLGAEYIDYVKFGWGTAIVTGCLREKISVLRDNAALREPGTKGADQGGVSTIIGDVHVRTAGLEASLQ